MVVVLSPGLVVTPPVGYLPHFPIVGWRNQVTVATVSADNELAAFPATNLANASTSQVWEGATADETLITVINLTGETDYVGLARHNLGSSDAVIFVSGMTAASSPAYVELLEYDPGDDTPMLLRVAKDFYTSIQLRIVPAGTAPRAAVLHVGELLTLPNGIQPGYTPLVDGQDVSRAVGWADSGEYLGSIVTGSRLTSSASIKDIDAANYDALVRPFVTAANRGAAFFFAWSPTDRPAEVGYCALEGAAKPVINQRTGQSDITLSMAGVAL